MVESRPYDDGKQFYPWRFYLMPHPEYETDTIRIEYERDAGKIAGVVLPENYFPDNDPARKPVNTWRHTANIYANWVNAIYEATSFDITRIPSPYR